MTVDDVEVFDLLHGVTIPAPSVYQKDYFDLTPIEAEQTQALYRWFHTIATAAIQTSNIPNEPVRAMRIEYLEDIHSWKRIHFMICRPGNWMIRMQAAEVLEYRSRGDDAGLQEWLVSELKKGSANYDKPMPKGWAQRVVEPEE